MVFVEHTGGSGYVSDGKFVRHDNNMSWFDVDPEWMVFTHLPDYQRQQYLTKPVAKELFMALPALYPGTSEMGIDSRKVLEMYRSGHTAGFPIINTIPGYDVKLVDFPMTRKLSVGEKYKISIRPSKGKLYAIIDNYKFRDNWQEKDGIMTIEVVPDSPGKLNLATATRNDEQYVLVLEYDIE